MSAISLRLPESLHEKAREVARQESVSVNQLITLALAEKLSALLAEDYLVKRARRGDRANFEAAMANVPDVEPEEADRL
jgi:predicted DNA-binding ribbon-helix-helix protein